MGRPPSTDFGFVALQVEDKRVFVVHDSTNAEELQAAATIALLCNRFTLARNLFMNSMQCSKSKALDPSKCRKFACSAF